MLMVCIQYINLPSPGPIPHFFRTACLPPGGDVAPGEHPAHAADVHHGAGEPHQVWGEWGGRGRESSVGKGRRGGKYGVCINYAQIFDPLVYTAGHCSCLCPSSLPSTPPPPLPSFSPRGVSCSLSTATSSPSPPPHSGASWCLSTTTLSAPPTQAATCTSFFGQGWAGVQGAWAGRGPPHPYSMGRPTPPRRRGPTAPTPTRSGCTGMSGAPLLIPSVKDPAHPVIHSLGPGALATHLVAPRPSPLLLCPSPLLLCPSRFLPLICCPPPCPHIRPKKFTLRAHKSPMLMMVGAANSLVTAR